MCSTRIREEKGLLSLWQMGTRLGVGKSTFCRWVREGKLPKPTHKHGAMLCYKKADVKKIRRILRRERPRRCERTTPLMRYAIAVLYQTGRFSQDQLAELLHTSQKTVINYCYADVSQEVSQWGELPSYDFL